MARALYSRKELLLVDDVLSGLDAKPVFRNVFGRRGICKMQNTTVVLATHAGKHHTDIKYPVQERFW